MGRDYPDYTWKVVVAAWEPIVVTWAFAKLNIHYEVHCPAEDIWGTFLPVLSITEGGKLRVDGKVIVS